MKKKEFFILKYFKNDIVRRVFMKNTFDGVITVLGILIATFFAKVNDPYIIIITSLGSGIAMFVSGIFGAYITEAAEQRLIMLNLEKQMLRKLNNTKLNNRSNENSIAVALFDGVSPLIVTLMMISPFFFNTFLGLNLSFMLSFTISILIIIFLGFFIGKISRDSVIRNILKLFGATFVLIIILFFVEKIK